MSAEFWAIIGVGVALAVGLQSRHAWTASRRASIVSKRTCSVKERLSRIEGWIAGRFREETAPSP